MAHIDFEQSLNTQKIHVARILHTTNGGWTCSIGESEVFLPGSQLYKDIEDYEAHVGKSVKVMVQRVGRGSIVVSHKDYVKKFFERKSIISNLQRGQKLSGIIKGITEKGYQINVMGIIGFMHKDEMCDLDNYDINCPIEISVQKADPENSILLLSQKLYNQICRKELEQKKKEELKKTYDCIEIGSVIICSVKQILKTGLSVDLGGVFGYLSYNEIPNNLTLAVNDTVEIVVIRKDDEKRRIAVSIKVLNEYKRLQSQNEFVSSLKPGTSRLYAKVYRIDKDSVRVKIENFKGIILREDISLNHIQRLDDEVFVNQELEVQFKEYRDSNIYCSLLFAEQERYPEAYYELENEDLLQTIGIGKEPILGKVVKSLSGSTNVVAMCQKSTGRILNDPISGVNMVAIVPLKYINLLMEGEFYEFNLKAWSHARRKSKHNPYIFEAIPISAYPQVQDNPYKISVDRKFRLRNNPLSNRDDARILDEIGADMYLNRGRMFYELLQNADDAAAKLGVRIRIQVVGNYLIFAHDGKSFDLKDFDAITSMANSRKSGDNSKTGYKGIGFKSVFTDSLQVLIKTGGFFFSFDKTSELFNDFEEFYDKVNNFLSDQQRALFYSDFSEYKDDFDKVNHMPWQLLPFWNNDIPEGLKKTLFEMRSNVSIALALKPGLADEYQKLIKGILQDPRFMLFLRRTRRIQFVDNGKTMTIAKNIRDGIVKLQNSFDENERNTSYIATIEEEIESSNENYTQCGIAMHKQCDTVGGKKKWSMYQDWGNNSTLVTNIPERVIEANTTGLSYAILLNEEGKVVPLPSNTPSLYAYLPMEDREHLLPFYVNADFMLKSQREGAKPTNPWNHFIFYNIGLKIPEWISKIARIDQPNYLLILPAAYFKEELEDEKKDELAVHFNRGYKESLSVTPFILNDKEEIVCQSDIVIDESGFSNIIEANDFCTLYGTTKRLVNNAINIEPLRNTIIFTEIEHLQTSNVVERILDRKNRFSILRFWLSITKELRFLVLNHIANMPGNRKNLDDQLPDIPAFTSKGKLYSFNKLLTSSSVILRTDTIKGIEEILLKLGLEITDEDVSTHAFQQKLQEQINAYTLHLFSIIAKKTETDAHKLSPQEKSSLFVHFASNKMDIKQEVLSTWEIFANQNGKIMPISELTHMDSSLYCDITRDYVIDESEYLAVGRSLDRYLMKEKDQFDKVVVNKWDDLVKEIGSNIEKAMALYLLASTTYIVAEHERVNDNKKEYFNDKNCVFVSESMHKIDDVIMNSSIADEDKIIPVIELLTGKLVVSDTVLKALQKVPFNCNEQKLEQISLSSDNVLSKEQIICVLDYCQRNNETVFNHYFIKEVEDGYVFSIITKECYIAYTNNDSLRTFIENNCKNLILLQEDFCKYTDIQGILTEEELLLKVLEIIQDVKPHADTLLPIYRNSISSVKRAYIEHISSIQMNDFSFTEDYDIDLQHLLMASSIEKQDEILFDKLRSLMVVVLDEKQYAFSSIKLQHTIELNGQKFPLSKLLPNEDKIAILVDNLKERLEEKHVSQIFIDSLFGNEIDENRADEVFAQLNKTNFILENGVQLAFVIKYVQNSKQKKNILCSVHDAESTPQSHSISYNWYINGEIFNDSSHVLATKYQDITRYLTLPYTEADAKWFIKTNVDDFQYIKDKLSTEEEEALLDCILEMHQKNAKLTNEDLKHIKGVIGIKDQEYVLSSKYSLPSELLPETITKWRASSDTENKSKFLKNIFGVHTDDSDIVKVRAFLDNGNHFSINTQNRTLSKMLSKWIAENSMSLNNTKFLTIVDVLDENDYIIEANTEELSKFESSEYRYTAFGDYYIYLCNGEIPWTVKLVDSGFIFHTYKEKDVILNGYNIFVNCNEEQSILDLVRSLINTDRFTAEDFMLFFDQEQKRVSGTLDGEIDDDIDEDARAAASQLAKQEAIEWLSAKGYDTRNVRTNYSFVEGVYKGTTEYNIVVKSFRSSSKELKINPNEWLHLLKPNSCLMLYMGHMSFAVVDRKALLGNHDFLRLRISSSNFSVDGTKLEESLEKLAKDIQYFERTHFVFERIHDRILSRANSLEDYGLFQSNSNQEYSAGNDKDIE